MRALVAIVTAAALSAMGWATSAAASKHHRHRAHQGPGMARTLPRSAVEAPRIPAPSRPGGCVTDEGGYRFAPCNLGGGGGGGAGGAGGGGM